ncbi:MAG: hypothetical protein U0900_23625 [Myxococcota bacterium]
MLKWLIGLLITSPLWFGGALYWASEYGGETVVLETADERGNALSTKLWVVDIHDEPWLRAGQPDATWLQRIQANPDVLLVRDGARTVYRAEIATYETDRINYTMREKYGYADQLISLIHDPEQVVAVRLYVPEPPL